MFLEWMAANKQNRLEWVLLAAKDWNDFANSKERMLRMKILVDFAHGYGIAAGADIPIAEQQQHTWYSSSPFPSLISTFEFYF